MSARKETLWFFFFPFLTAAEPDGRLRHPPQSEDDHGHQPPRHTGPSPAEARATGPQDP